MNEWRSSRIVRPSGILASLDVRTLQPAVFGRLPNQIFDYALPTHGTYSLRTASQRFSVAPRPVEEATCSGHLYPILLAAMQWFPHSHSMSRSLSLPSSSKMNMLTTLLLVVRFDLCRGFYELLTISLHFASATQWHSCLHRRNQLTTVTRAFPHADPGPHSNQHIRVAHSRRQSVPTSLPGNWTSQGCFTYATIDFNWNWHLI